MNKNGIRSFFKNISYSFLRQILVGVIQLATVVIIARSFGPEGNGAYAVVLLLPLMLSNFLNFGVASSNVYYINSKVISPIDAWCSTVLLYSFVVFFGLGIGIIVVAFYGEVLFPGISKDVLYCSLLIFPVVLLLNYSGGFFQAIQDFKKYNLILLFPPLITMLIVGVVAVFFTYNLVFLLFSYFIGSLVSLIIALFMVKKRLQNNECGHFSRVGYLKKALGFGLKLHFSNIVTFLNYRSDLLLVNFFIGPVGAGIYVVAVQLSEKLWILSTAVSVVLLPRLSDIGDEKNNKVYLASLSCRWVLMLTLISSILLALISGFFVRKIFGEEFVGVSSVLIWLIPGVVLWAGGRVISNYIASQGKPEINLYISAVILFLNILGNVLFIPIYGIHGAAMATSLAYAIDFAFKIHFFIKFSGVKSKFFIFDFSQDLKAIKSLYDNRKNLGSKI